jgi:hypothetical protein
MAAGLGFKTFNTGDVLSAADVNGYLMQNIWVFANATARDAAVTSPQEGNFAFTKDNNSLWYYDGAAWVASGATGDIEGVTAGVGISGGGTSGTVTVTNSMATAIDAKGDLVVGTGADTFSKLTVGANGTTLVADSAEATGLKWATASSGGMTLISTTTLSGSTVSLTSISGSYKELNLLIQDAYCSGTNELGIRFNSDTSTANYMSTTLAYTNAGQTPQYITEYATQSFVSAGVAGTASGGTIDKLQTYLTISRYSNTDTKSVFGGATSKNSGLFRWANIRGNYYGSSAITQIDLITTSGTFSGGTAYLYGVS